MARFGAGKGSLKAGRDKRTSIGASNNTQPTHKNARASKHNKRYRGQGRA